MTHAQLIHNIRLAVGQIPGVVLWPNVNAVLRGEGGRLMRTGLTPGAADLIGICPDGLFLAIEVKVDKDTVKPHQARFLALVVTLGGRAGEARSVGDALAIVRGEKQWSG